MKWKPYLRILVAGLALQAHALPALANWDLTQGAGTHIFAIDATNQGTALCAGAQVECPASVPVNTAGAPIFTAAVPGVVSQATAASLNATVIGTGTFATQAAQTGAWNVGQTGTWTVQPGNTANTTAWLVTGTGGVFPSSQSGAWNVGPVAAATWGLGATGAAVPANAHYIAINTGGNLVGWTGTVTAVQPTGTNLHVVCDSGCAAGATPSNYGTSPGAIPVAAVNAYVTNSTALGRNVVALSNPVVPVAAISSVSALPAATTAVVLKATPGTLFGVQLGGIATAPVYVKFYDNATTCSGTPKKQLIIPVAATPANGAGSNLPFGPGIAFGTGIVYCATLDITNTNTGAPTANTVIVNVDFE